MREARRSQALGVRALRGRSGYSPKLESLGSGRRRNPAFLTFLWWRLIMPTPQGSEQVEVGTLLDALVQARPSTSSSSVWSDHHPTVCRQNTGKISWLQEIAEVLVVQPKGRR